MRLLHVLPSLDPSGGGPTEAVRQGGVRCVDMGHEVEVLSLDDPAAPFLSEFPLRVHAIGPSRGAYRYNSRLSGWMRTHARRFDAVIINGLWQYHSFGAWRALQGAGVPYFVFTHGMLDPWFKKTYPLKHIRKWLYWPWAEYRVLRDADAVLFTCEEERLLARKSFWLYKAHETVVAFGTSQPPREADRLREMFLAAYPGLRGKRLLLFLGRIQAKKGCDLLLQAFARVCGADPTLHVVMAGPDQVGWCAELQALASSLGIGERVSWPGMLQGDLKWGAFYASEAFALPSHQENFGIAVAEALGCSLPVLISDKVNIWREIEADGAGFVATDSVDGTTHNLRRWLDLVPHALDQMRMRALASFERRFTVDAMSVSLIAAVVQAQRAVSRA
jgi:glycosyltransferase involved in cell wall biosynthesis